MPKPPPFTFVLDALERAGPETKPMFGCTAIYLGEKIVMILRDRESSPRDNGIWLATLMEHHASLKAVFPEMRSIEVFGPGETGWQVLPSESTTFEEDALKACKLVLAADPRIGKVPKRKKLKTKGRKRS